mmetsp:Transcript_48316/g.40883  ORF Transcript_48316/g.40883 Transcript_48316/m.40883 type:complete len:203 (-) Transcript_48316:641-1249(-)
MSTLKEHTKLGKRHSRKRGGRVAGAYTGLRKRECNRDRQRRGHPIGLRDPFNTPIVLNEKSMRCGKSLQKRCMPRVGRSKIQPGRPRIREMLGRSVAPVATQPDDKRAGGRVEGRNSAALIGCYPKTPPKVGHLNLHGSKFAKMWRPIQMPTSSSMPAHRLNNSVIHLCHTLREKRSGCVTPQEGHARILAEMEELIVKQPI